MPERTKHDGLLLHPSRAAMWAILREKPATIAHFVKHLGLSSTSVRWHIGKLVAAGVLRPAKSDPRRFEAVDNEEARVAQAAQLLLGLPARELLQAIIRRPGLHIGELAAKLGAPRSRYWRCLPPLREAGLVAVQTRVRAQLLFPTPRGRRALQAIPRDMRAAAQARSRRPATG